jgi:hypothetical protein
MQIPRFRIKLCSLGLSLPHAVAQDKPKSHGEAAVFAARSEDVSSIEAIVKTDYECVPGGIGVARQWARDFSLYDPFARSFVPSKDEKTGALVIWHPTQQEYADESDAQLVRDGFSEHELAHKIYKYGNVATVFSSYEVSVARTGKLYSRGANIYQLYNARNRWWISSVSWDTENNINPIPQELMPKN